MSELLLHSMLKMQESLSLIIFVDSKSAILLGLLTKKIVLFLYCFILFALFFFFFSGSDEVRRC